MLRPDVLIVGAGIGGSALATVLARAGLEVMLLEKTLVHKDVVRGEWIAPWGAAETKTLDLYELYRNNGAHSPRRHTTYHDLVTPAEAERATLPLTELTEDLPLCLGHPAMCNLLNLAAEQANVQLIRGISSLSVQAGKPPKVTFAQQGTVTEVQPRWVVGADGRNGVVARQIGAKVRTDPEHHLFSGMLVENASGWPEDLQAIGVEGDVNVLAFPQGNGRVRIYLGWPSEQRTRLLGPNGPANFLQAWNLECLPYADAIAGATPASPCIAYPNNDAWVDHPVTEGVVLIGDAAGRNDPIIGQGLSITHRDVRLVRDAFLGQRHWSAAMFDDYVRERQERMRRLRIVARLTSLRDSSFGPQGQALRRAIHERLQANPELQTPFAAAFVGPEALPTEVYLPKFTDQITGQPLWSH